MGATMFDSNTYGIGELITQRKLFSVPIHQRNYSWAIEQVEQLLADIEVAFANKANDYFIGLVVLRGPHNAIWEVLDGQQRLTTVTMIYSAIRCWLKERGFDGDASQIETEYLGVRQLGGEFSTRIHLNSINHVTFEKFVIAVCPTADLIKERDQLGRKTSNFLLLDAALHCRQWIDTFANNVANTRDGSAKALFSLSRFLETSVKVVSVDVATDADAYVLFESLNNRGADLSALDLVKNYIFSIAVAEDLPYLEALWDRLTVLIEDTDADDFLKFFWTARFGIIQKSDLFRRIRQSFQGQQAAKVLLEELLDAARFAEALDDTNHEVWLGVAIPVQEAVVAIKTIGSKQARPLLYSVFKKLPEGQLAAFLEDLTVCLVRFQMIGHGRTGVLEKVLGRACTLVWGQQSIVRDQWLSVLKELMISDEQFLSDFAEHREQKVSRAHYVLVQIEKARGAGPADLDNAKCLHLPPYPVDDPEENFKKLGSYFLLESNLGTEYARATRQKSPDEIIRISETYFRQSRFTTTNITDVRGWNTERITERTHALAEEACRRWKIG